MKLNLGCGPVQPSGWINVDGSNRAWLAKRVSWLDRLLVCLRIIAPTEFNRKIVYANLLKLFPWNEKSVEAIYLGEMLEHFTEDEGKHILHECYRVLRPGGIIRIRVPSHAEYCREYLEEYERAKAHPGEKLSSNYARLLHSYYSNVCTRRPKIWQSMGHYHKCAFDDISLTLLIESIGFQNAERKAFHQSAIPKIEEVEVANALIIEATRPSDN